MFHSPKHVLADQGSSAEDLQIQRALFLADPPSWLILRGLQTGAVAGVVVLQHGFRVAPGVARERGVADRQPALPPAGNEFARGHFVLGAAPLAQLVAACSLQVHKSVSSCTTVQAV